MDERFDHLELPLYSESFERQARRGGARPTARPKEEKQKYYELQIQQFASMKESLEADKSRYEEYLDPNLIFKLEITQSVDENAMRQNFRRMDIDVLSPSPDKKGFWVVFADDEEVKKFREKLELYAEKDRYSFFNALGTIAEIPIEEKIGDRLAERELEPGESAYLDVEVWRMEDERLSVFLGGLERLITSRGGSITDRLVKDSFCLLRVKADEGTVAEILPLREIASVDRPPKPYIEFSLLSIPMEDVSVGDSPPENSAAIAILDSGILSGHPLLQNAVGDEIAVGTKYSGKIKDEKPEDDVGHGTKVAGLALYGDLKACVQDGVFSPEVWLLSAKVMFREENPVTGKIEAKYDEEELLEHQLEKAVRYFVEHYPNCRVVNLSLGDEYKKMFGSKRQFNLAALVDELSKELKLVFVISAGNFQDFESKGFPDTYPDYLIQETEDVKIIDPATAALGLTVGSITQEYGPLNIHPSDLLFSPADTNYPSPFTRVGPGYQGMIKPEVVEEGGNVIEGERTVLEDIGGKLVTLNPAWITEGRLFTVDCGTSFSAPTVANYVARLFNKFPDYSHNLIKALLISSAQIPSGRPRPLSEIELGSSDSAYLDLLKVYGYGKPCFERAMFSANQRVLLLREKSIGLNAIDVYFFYLPDEFITMSGRKRLAVTLVYDPPVNKNRVDYFGCSMEFHLFRNMEVDDVLVAYKPIKVDLPADEIIPDDLRVSEVKLQPGVNLRKKGVHQKGIVEYVRRPGFDTDKPLVLAVICQKRWIRDEEYLQDYAVVVTVEHSASIDLFNRTRTRNQERVRVALRGT